MSNTTLTPEVIEQAFQKFQATISPELKLQFNGRLERGLAIAQNHGVSPYTDPTSPNIFHMFKVISSNPQNSPYLVDLHARSCTCPDHWKGHFCKHRIAASITNLAVQIARSRVKDTVQQVEAKPITTVETPPPPEKETITWAVMQHQGKWLGVEVISQTDGVAVVRALPAVVSGSKLEPQFPFADGLSSMETVPAQNLTHFKDF